MLQKLIVRKILLIVVIFTISFFDSLKAQQLNRDQLIELRTKLSEYKKIKDYEAREPLVEKILEMGPKGASKLLKVVEKNFISVQKKYITNLAKKAKAVQKKRYKRRHKKEIKENRSVFAGFRTKGNALGKAEIVSKGDPALQKLKDLLFLSAEDVLAENEKLQNMRMLIGLKALTIDVRLCAAARDHSNDMRGKSFFSHESPIPGKKQPVDRARNFGTTANSENIAYGRPSASGTNMQWFHSPGHHLNMLRSSITIMGLGRSEKHWTQMFR